MPSQSDQDVALRILYEWLYERGRTLGVVDYMLEADLQLLGIEKADAVLRILRDRGLIEFGKRANCYGRWRLSGGLVLIAERRPPGSSRPTPESLPSDWPNEVFVRVENPNGTPNRQVELGRCSELPTGINLHFTPRGLERAQQLAFEAPDAAQACQAPEEPKKKRGRRTDTDHKQDAEIAELWQLGQYRRYREFATEFRERFGFSDKAVRTGDAVKRALDRHKKRLKQQAEGE